MTAGLRNAAPAATPSGEGEANGSPSPSRKLAAEQPPVASGEPAELRHARRHARARPVAPQRKVPAWTATTTVGRAAAAERGRDAAADAARPSERDAPPAVARRADDAARAAAHVVFRAARGECLLDAHARPRSEAGHDASE